MSISITLNEVWLTMRRLLNFGGQHLMLAGIDYIWNMCDIYDSHNICDSCYMSSSCIYALQC